ncbi:hypothetical protein TI39_contig272g00011 [Zymoseptoria brevis]|uniref:BTB domain-containing protein n=1 Tax=Zymoseptoria brevis TaxID=1047168 RepID=A0A0F4GX03_9PEZI|nr:hypothetical protein TI39_contig272g00011 [Zymoseptoria brevis]
MAAQALPLITSNCHTMSQAGTWSLSSSDRNAPFGVPQPSPHATVEPHLLVHTKLYAAATKYGIDGLKALAMKKLNIQLTRHFDSAELADMIHFVRTEDLAGDEGLLEALANVLSWHPVLLDKHDIEVAVKGCPRLAFEMLKRGREPVFTPQQQQLPGDISRSEELPYKSHIEVNKTKMSRSRSKTGDMALFWVPDGIDDEDMPLFIDQDDWAPIHEAVAPARYDTVELSTGNLQNGMIELCFTGELTDFTIICGADVYQVHAVVLVGQSTFFGAAVLGGFEEGTIKTMRLTPMDDELDFFYLQDYEFEEPCMPSRKKIKLTINSGNGHVLGKQQLKRTPSDDMIGHARVFAIALKYGVPALKRAAVDKFQSTIKTHWSHNDFPSVIEEVYSSTPDEVRELREVVARTILKNPKSLRSKEVEATIRSIDGLAFDLLKLKTNK